MADSENDRDLFPQTRLSLIGRIRGGTAEEKQQALGSFFESYQPALLHFLVRCKGLSENDAEELIQDFVVNKIVNGKVLELATGEGRFRYVLKRCVQNYFLDALRKKKRDRHQFTDENYDRASTEEDANFLDNAWAEAILRKALLRMKSECAHWDLYQSQVLSDQPLPYRDVVSRFNYESPKQASNYLINAKRLFNRIMADCLEDQSILSGEYSKEDLTREIDNIRLQLGNSNRISQIVESLDEHKPSLTSPSLSTGYSMLDPTIDFVDTSTESAWSKSDAGQILEHLLERPISDFSKSASTPCTIKELLRHQGRTEEHLKDLVELKEVFNERGKLQKSELPVRVDVTMTYLLIAEYILADGAPEGITSMRRDQLTKRLSQLVDKDWIPPRLRQKFREAVTKLLQ